MSDIFKFKSSGVKITHRKFKPTKNQIKSKMIPIGIKTPLEFGIDNNEFLKCHTDPVSQLKDNLRNLILTNNGERLGRFNLGCNLHSLLMENNALDNTLKSEIIKTINNQVMLNIPLINIQDIIIDNQTKNKSNSPAGLSMIIILIKFSVPKLQQKDLAIKVNMLMGG